MPSSDYTSASGGALRMKGGSGISKKKKRKPKPTDSSSTALTTSNPATDPSKVHSDLDAEEGIPRAKSSRATSETAAEEAVRKAGGRKKTEAEKRHEEMRRKRLDEKIKREGIKTHKEKVEELNKYLSGLSEHHDMPKIGPG
ncbi:DUF1754-domain-containing protein [Pleomassaria siparia CBS 279.74]|uniref:DUF1754-domain-containing protein n=1 Tax=Pleomassaria siparia CBS 279.74 TaxID=1314801 RepID=A0A6G1KBQ3_9PLEO|nr:DUF1754-domain-containing protein [Pleomassaria siparia CBS 279.74]